MKPTFFAKPSDFRKWLEKNHTKETELLVGFYKVDSGKPSITWPQSVDEALCFGWIDGVRRSIDAESYSIRFTPRKSSSIWSAINIKKIEDLTKKGLMKPAGIAAYGKRSAERSAIYTYERAPITLDPTFEKQFKANKKAYAFFLTLQPSVQRISIDWVMRAKQEKTRTVRMESLISRSAEGKKIKSQSYN